MNTFPEWLRRPWPSGDAFGATKDVVEAHKLHTVCQSARCPNLGECWARGTATVMVLGNTCTRNCTFCSVDSGHPDFDDLEEPMQVARAVQTMGLKHAVITTVVRDDLPDGGAEHIASTIESVRELNPDTTIEVLISDFGGNLDAVDTVLAAEPEVFGHNIETVRRMYSRIRDRRFTYENALRTLERAAQSSSGPIVKSAMMLGFGENRNDVEGTLKDVRNAGAEVMCMGQYLQPTPRQDAVTEFVHPDRFAEYEALAYDLGFAFVVSGPFVRSSYRAEAVLETDLARSKLAARR